MQNRSTSLRAIFALVVAIAAPMVSGAHLAFTRHVTCIEHGELVEVGPADGAHAAQPETRVTGVADAESHGHDHCAATRAERDGIARVSLDEAGPAPCLHAIAPPGAPARASTSLFRLAPKTSPPV